MPEKTVDNIALPGFEGLVLPDTDRAGSQDFKDKQYTGLKIRRDYPQTFESVVRALFYYKLPVRTCCDLFHMNSQCVSAIRDMVIAEAATDARAAFLINNRQRSQRDIILTRLVEAIAEKLDASDGYPDSHQPNNDLDDSHGRIIAFFKRLFGRGKKEVK